MILKFILFVSIFFIIKKIIAKLLAIIIQKKSNKIYKIVFNLVGKIYIIIFPQNIYILW